MIPFKLPQLSMSLCQYMEIVDLQRKAGTCVGYLISLGKKFFEVGVSQVDSNIIPQLKDMASPHVNPRVVPSYGILLWFSLEV